MTKTRRWNVTETKDTPPADAVERAIAYCEKDWMTDEALPALHWDEHWATIVAAARKANTPTRTGCDDCLDARKQAEHARDEAQQRLANADAMLRTIASCDEMAHQVCACAEFAQAYVDEIEARAARAALAGETEASDD
jgi:hypothetical protein